MFKPATAETTVMREIAIVGIVSRLILASTSPPNSTSVEYCETRTFRARIQQTWNNVFMVPKAGRGRPAADGQDRQSAIRSAARLAFDELGFDRASLREIASRAGVDPKLVLHYFKSKSQLFAESMVFPAQSRRALDTLRVSPKKDWGWAFADIVMQPDGHVVIPPLLGVLKSATSNPQVAQTLRAFYIRTSIGTALEELGIDNAPTRAACLSSVLAGYVFADQILQIPIGDENAVAIRRRIFAETVQLILTAKVDELRAQRT